MRLFLYFILFVTSSATFAQQAITLEDIWQNYAFYGRGIPGFNFMNDGQHYTLQNDNKITKYDLTTGNTVDVLFDGDIVKGPEGWDGKFDSYVYSDDENYILFATNTRSIYRRSSEAIYYLYDTKAKRLGNVYEQPISNPSLSPDKKYIAFTHQNNLYTREVTSGKITQITTDGKKNEIINGSTDWVYEEEFSIVKAYEWAPDSKSIAYIRFDESEVPEFTMTLFKDELYPEYETWKYPKVGEKNASVTTHIYNLANKKTTTVDLGDLTDMYIPRIKWNPANELIVYKMNRHQNHLQLFRSKEDGKTSLLLEEKNPYYIDITDDLTFLDDGTFIWSSEKDGYNQLYYYKADGTLNNKITDGYYDVSGFYGVDKDGWVYYQSAEASHLQKQVYKIRINGQDKTNMNPYTGTNEAIFSTTFDYFVNTHSDINTPPSYTVWTKDLKLIRTIEDNADIKNMQETYGVSKASFFTFKNGYGDNLDGYMILPPDFDESKQYPLFMYQYSGPGSQSANDSWKGTNYWWFQMLAQQGYVIACVDGRGTGMRGEDFKKKTYLQLGKYETEDQIAAAKYLGSLPYIDASRIGIYGWSYGGYMSSLCILKGNDIFKAAIAVAPVTSWKWYDTIYTERYMRTLAENEAGYNDNSPIYFADRLKGAYLLIHGNADDNVHFQNTAEMANALIKANKQFDTYFYPNRNHGIYGGNTRLHLFTKMTNFIKENI